MYATALMEVHSLNVEGIAWIVYPQGDAIFDHSEMLAANDAAQKDAAQSGAAECPEIVVDEAALERAYENVYLPPR